jgi:hypothetical protein
MAKSAGGTGALTARDLIPDVVAEEPDVPRLKLAMPPLDNMRTIK